MTAAIHPHATGTVEVEPRSPHATAVRLEGVSRLYGNGASRLLALDRITLDVRRGEFVCVLGASGCGKSTLLSLIAGLDRPTAGRLQVDGGHGRAALMFQEAALLPWLTVQRNVELPMRLQRVPAARRRSEVRRLLELVHLAGFDRRRPHELSGGMRQRVALARALAQDAEVLLMDEPFGALDAITRDALHEELTGVWEQTGVTVLFVTHNVREAVRLGDRVVVLSSRPGRVIHDLRVEVPRPRRIETPQVAALAAEITDELRHEIARHGDG